MGSILTTIFEWLKSALVWVVELLPDSPFTAISNTPIAQYLPWINWFVPFDFVVLTLTTWLIAVGGYYVYSVILRWVKAVE